MFLYSIILYLLLLNIGEKFYKYSGTDSVTWRVLY